MSRETTDHPAQCSDSQGVLKPRPRHRRRAGCTEDGTGPVAGGRGGLHIWGPAEGAAGCWGLGWCRQDNEWPSTPPRPREDVMEKRKLVCVWGCLKEEGAWADVVSEGAGVWIPPATRRTGGILATPPSTRLTAWVHLLQPWSPRRMRAPSPACPHTRAGTPRPLPPYMDPETSPPPHPTLRAFFWPLLSSPPHQVGAHRGHSRSWIRSCGLSSETLGSILSLLIPSEVLPPQPQVPTTRQPTGSPAVVEQDALTLTLPPASQGPHLPFQQSLTPQPWLSFLPGPHPPGSPPLHPLWAQDRDTQVEPGMV